MGQAIEVCGSGGYKPPSGPVVSPKPKPVPGDVTIWSNFSTLHVAPPVKKSIDDPADARLMYRMSCKGDPSYTLPRDDAPGWIDDNIVPPYRTPLT